MNIAKPTFDDFLASFTVQDLPLILTEESISDFERLSNPIPQVLIYEFIEPEPDEFTEFVPCFKLPGTKDFHAVVFWKGELMKYQYILTTYDKNGNQISSAIIGGIYSDGDIIVRSIATIEEDWVIHIVEGQQPASELQFAPQLSKGYQMKLDETGEISFLEGNVSEE